MSEIKTILLTEPNEIVPEAVVMLKNKGYNVVTEEGSNPSEIDALFIRSYTTITSDYLDRFPNLQVILRAGVGLDNIDVSVCEKRNIKIFNSPGANSDAVAEYALTMTMYSLRQINSQGKNVLSGKWRELTYVGESITSKKIGLLGCGNAGKALAKKLSALQVECLGYDPYVSAEDMAKIGVQKRELEELLSESDVVVVLVPLMPATTNLLSQECLALLKPTAYLINVSRGEIIDETALIALLKQNKIKGVVLDVVVGEPNVNSELLALPNVVITPHIAGFTVESNKQICTAVVENFIMSEQGK
jgi:D-3-phosphoglycerate dehydrogenase